MSVQVLRIRFPVLSVAISVERPRRLREGRPRARVASESAFDRLAQRSHPTTGTSPNLIKLQM